MKRRAFLAGLGGGVVGSTFATPAVSAASRGEPLVLIYISNVPQMAGDMPLPSRGEAVLVRREPDYKYDPQALVVMTEDGRRLGYVPPIHSQIIEPILSAGYKTHAWVEESKPVPRPQIRIALCLHRPEEHHA